MKEVSLVLAELQSKTKKNNSKKLQQQEVTLLGERSEPHIVQSRFRVIYIVSVVGQNAWAELHGPNTRMLKFSLGRLKLTCDTRVIHYNYTLEQL